MRRAFSILVVLAAGMAASAARAATDAVVAQPSQAATLAEMLADADRHAAKPSRKARRALGSALALFDRMGLHAHPGTNDDALAEWRRIAGRGTTTAYRGRVLGPAYRRGWLAAGQAVQVEQLFLSGQSASVSVANVPDGPLVLGVTGPDGRPNCIAAARNCDWIPSFTQRYTITVRNMGNAAIRFYLVMD